MSFRSTAGCQHPLPSHAALSLVRCHSYQHCWQRLGSNLGVQIGWGIVCHQNNLHSPRDLRSNGMGYCLCMRPGHDDPCKFNLASVLDNTQAAGHSGQALNPSRCRRPPAVIPLAVVLQPSSSWPSSCYHRPSHWPSHRPPSSPSRRLPPNHRPPSLPPRYHSRPSHLQRHRHFHHHDQCPMPTPVQVQHRQTQQPRAGA